MTLRRFLCTGMLGMFLALMPAASDGPTRAQERATLVSDRLEIADNRRLIARGNVEAFYHGSRLRASSVTYDRVTDRLLIEGPITLVDADGGTLILASGADLSADMQDGLLTSARLVLDEQMQLAARNLTRVGGRYTALNDVVASSCRICANSPTPLWEIRARRVVHDELRHQLHFDKAQLRAFGVPIFYIPHLRMPDPTVERATGFLAPDFRMTSSLGAGIHVPYFIAIDETRDLTIAPYVTSKGGMTVDLRFREAFRRGDITLQGAITHDRLTTRDRRGYVMAEGAFDLPDDFRLTFGLQLASDNAYLLDYGYSDADRLDSRITLSRTRRDGHFSARLVGIQSLRDDENNNTLPSIIGDVTFQRRFTLGPLGGQGGLRLEAHQHYRTSGNPLDGDGDGIADGRDVGRLSVAADWRRAFMLPAGVEATAIGAVRGDVYAIHQDAIFAGTRSRLHGAAGMELRWPWIRAQAGSTQIIEPVIQLLWADRQNLRIPNEDSALVEFDEGNLFALERFPGADAVEWGRRANVGVTWSRHDVSGWDATVTAGRIYRSRENLLFGPASGLRGRNSDWLAAVGITSPSGWQGIGRAVLDDSFSLTKGELRLGVETSVLALGASALWVVADAGDSPFNPARPGEDRDRPTRELRLDARWKATPALTARFNGGYDVEAKRGTRAGIGMEFRNECIAVDVYLSRRFSSSASVTPTTDFGLSVDLIGFGSGKKPGPSRRCYSG